MSHTIIQGAFILHRLNNTIDEEEEEEVEEEENKAGNGLKDLRLLEKVSIKFKEG